MVKVLKLIEDIFDVVVAACVILTPLLYIAFILIKGGLDLWTVAVMPPLCSMICGIWLHQWWSGLR